MLRLLEPLLEPDGVFFFEGPLEENTSLVRFCNRAFTQLKRATGRDLLADLPPLHLSRTSAVTQRRFIEGTMGYELLAFDVTETGWPYLVAGTEAGKDTKSKLRGIIGQAAVSFARIGNRAGATLGNRFSAIASPSEQRSEIGVSGPIR